jgi:hypothetical protein
VLAIAEPLKAGKYALSRARAIVGVDALVMLGDRRDTGI